MAKGPSPSQVQRAMAKANAEAQAVSKELGVNVTPRFLRASNGEASILFYVGNESFFTTDLVRRIFNDRKNKG